MAHIAIVGAGLGGMPWFTEMREAAHPGDRITVISNAAKFHFVPSNPWVAGTGDNVMKSRLEIAPLLNKHNIDFIPIGVKRLHPDENSLELEDGQRIDYDFLVIATGPKLAF